ncbi:Bax inhibitor-1/YccA family protein [Alloscardovia criceti]|uniref:Bax inhibitor-1/YccA family protein n=1 Tax=Alloscardovia criceti TaxID=356828 RepID=UPI0003654D17|nr:Bax inhibitor-1/YccA family protein [Alloscardovia criceti]
MYNTPDNQPQNFQNSPNQTPYQQAYTQTSMAQNAQAERISVARTYGEMTIGLVVTAVVAYFSYATGLFSAFFQSTGTFGLIILSILQIGIVIFLSARVMSMKPSTARLAFYAYAALMGFTLSTIFAAFNINTIFLAFAFSAAFFFALTMCALTTKVNLLKLGPILQVALIVLIISQIVMMFMGVGTQTMLLSAITMIIFAGFTAYDAQVARALFQQFAGNTEMIKRVSIICALNLYLDFINFFISLLNIFADRS